MLEPDEILQLHRHRRREERDVDDLALARVARPDECREDARREQEARGEVGHGNATRTHGHGVAGGRMRRQQPRARLRDEVVGGGVGQRACTTEGAHAPDDERRIGGVHLLPAEPEPRGTFSGIVVHDDVRTAQQARARREPLRRLEIDDDGALSTVERDEVATDSGGDRQHVAVPVACGRLDLDHVRAQVGEEHAAERAGDVLRVLDHAHAFEGQRHLSPSPRRAMTTCRISADPPEMVEPTDAR